MLDDQRRTRLLSAARRAAQNAYCPYSKFRVGAAVLVGNEIFTGCNIENDSYSLTLCAERVAVFSAVAAGHETIDAIAISCPDIAGAARAEEVISCGACRQVLSQFAGPNLPVILDGFGALTLGEMLPHPFKLSKRLAP
jgi:cytidine deaminase